MFCRDYLPSFLSKHSWSPDGAHITASNATNNKGFVFIAAVITRGTWTSEISLVGHENTVEVAVCVLSPVFVGFNDIVRRLNSRNFFVYYCYRHTTLTSSYVIPQRQWPR
jgi:hypothetical protein